MTLRRQVVLIPQVPRPRIPAQRILGLPLHRRAPLLPRGTERGAARVHPVENDLGPREQRAEGVQSCGKQGVVQLDGGDLRVASEPAGGSWGGGYPAKGAKSVVTTRMRHERRDMREGRTASRRCATLDSTENGEGCRAAESGGEGSAPQGSSAERGGGDTCFRRLAARPPTPGVPARACRGRRLDDPEGPAPVAPGPLRPRRRTRVLLASRPARPGAAPAAARAVPDFRTLARRQNAFEPGAVHVAGRGAGAGAGLPASAAAAFDGFRRLGGLLDPPGRVLRAFAAFCGHGQRRRRGVRGSSCFLGRRGTRLPFLGPAPHAADNPSARPSRELITFRREFGGGLVGVPDLVGLNVSCATEIRGSAEMPPRQELLRAAKFALWKFVLGREDPSDAERLLEAWGGAPPVSSLAYARYPDPAPALVTAHLRSGFNHQQYCYARMRFPLCATSDALSAQHLAPLLSGCGSQVVALLAGDTLTGAFVYTRDLARAYLAALRHPSLNFTHHRTTTWINYYGTNAENAYYSLAAILIDQVLLACGSAVPGGAYFRTHMSTFSWRAAILGSDVLSAVCLPSGTRLPTSFDAASTAADADAELHAFAEAGVDLAAEHKAPPGNVTRRTMGPGAWHVGCTATGRFLPSLPFEDRRRGDPKGAGKCSSCGDSRW
ncbi:hypothetical protein DFJ74DRAFT_454448 [Hyaloraphidium curvatum]|nr:hypothetical protein DFJ74DRAFT_454448 [Hyaloraphidium curvatum]